MGDCLYHGSYGGHYCPECEEERRRNMKQGTIAVDSDTFKAKQQMAARESNLPLGLDINGNSIKKK